MDNSYDQEYPIKKNNRNLRFKINCPNLQIDSFRILRDEKCLKSSFLLKRQFQKIHLHIFIPLEKKKKYADRISSKIHSQDTS